MNLTKDDLFKLNLKSQNVTSSWNILKLINI